MPRKADLGCPDWVISIILAWARRERAVALGGLGFYRINPMLRDGIPVQARSFEPTGYTGSDVDDVEIALRKLEAPRLLAVMRYVLPERARSIDAEWQYSADSWLRHLKAALQDLTRELDTEQLRISRRAATVAEIR